MDAPGAEGLAGIPCPVVFVFFSFAEPHASVTVRPMKCPACYNELTPRRAGQITVDVCDGGCRGIWFDNFELKRVDAAGAAALAEIWRDQTITVDFVKKRKCPRCAEQTMLRRFFSRKRAVEIDECPNCGGLWLDAGEFERVLEELQPQEQPPLAVNSAISSALTALRSEAR